ncbi:MAG: YARHG domain-containing protein [Chitinophagaceae bacterium]|nr:YARHG domain-containing protein [Chitinophagaceae bacterium]MBL0336524.1 YARHG domain-containing protein [Chitinophagaceae bacterium]
MKKFLSVLLFTCFLIPANANDGVYFASGNHLIPVFESDITVRKEILTIKKIRNQFIEVTVYYEFFNPGADKTVLVGFEAASPSGDVDGTPKNGMHPYMRDFTVNLNNQILSYKVAYVNDSFYAKNGKINSMTLAEAKKGITNTNEVEFMYVYYFDARFKKGVNIVKHTYNYDLSGSVDLQYDFEYILTAAKRWANKQIDDFTLVVDMGEFEQFRINKYFFTNSSSWLINGIGKTTEFKAKPDTYPDQDATIFTIQKGNIIYQQKNFKPKGELFIYTVNYIPEGDTFNAAEHTLPFSYEIQDRISPPADDFSKKILKNLPFARRGYVFTNKELQQYFEKKADWYIPNPNYVPEVEIIHEKEKSWIEKWK